MFLKPTQWRGSWSGRALHGASEQVNVTSV